MTSVDLSIPSIVNWLSDTIDHGDADAALYVAEARHDSGYITIGTCMISDLERLELSPDLGRIRYISCADPEICDKRRSLSLKDCWLAQQFLMFQLADYREFISSSQVDEVHNSVEMLKLPESGASRFIEWIAETSQKIFSDPQVGYRLCLDSLVTTSRQRLLYEKVKLQWSQDA